MKPRHMLISLLALSAPAWCADLQKAYILPFESDGSIAVAENGDYADLIEMTARTDGSFAADNVTIDFGFQFYALSDASGSVRYGLPVWAANPAVEILPNPLAVTAADEPIELLAGTYDFALYPSDEYGILFTATPVDDSRTYPASIYLIYGNGSTDYEEITGDGTGVYTGVLNLEVPFRISYEPRAGAFVYGPTSGLNTTLLPDERVDIEYGAGTDATIAYPNKARTIAQITVSLEPEDSYVLVEGDPGSSYLPSIEIPDDSADHTTTYYTLSGTPVASVHGNSTPRLAPGIYIVRNGSTTSKQFIAP